MEHGVKSKELGARSQNPEFRIQLGLLSRCLVLSLMVFTPCSMPYAPCPVLLATEFFDLTFYSFVGGLYAHQVNKSECGGNLWPR